MESNQMEAGRIRFPSIRAACRPLKILSKGHIYLDDPKWNS